VAGASVSAAASITRLRISTRVEPRVAIKSTLEHALIGLIAELPDVSGYDIIRIFEISMVHFWHARQGQIYPTLDRMERAGLITHRDVIQHGRPNKREFRVTPRGREFLTKWLASAPEPMRIKHPALLRTRFLGHLDYDEARSKLIEQRDQAMAYVELFKTIERENFGAPLRHRSKGAMFSYFTLRYGLDWMEQTARWCDWAIGEVERNRSLFKPLQRGPAREPRLAAADGTR
jgi:DNA-binding PadR family transcriptional regulator